MSKTRNITDKIPVLWLIVAITWGLIMISYFVPDVDWSLLILLAVAVMASIAVSDWAIVPTKKTEKRSRNLTEIRGIGPKRSEKLRTAGIESLKKLATYTPQELAKKIAVSEKTASKWIKRAKKISQER